MALCPSHERAKDWKTAGAVVLDKDSIGSGVELLRNKEFDDVAVILNKYDGIDLPDDTCRILVLDSRPFSEILTDRYEESCRASSDITTMKLTRTVEQGLGRAVRGEKDYCVVLIVGPSLVKFIRGKKTRAFLSVQTNTQIQIGLDIADLAKEDIEKGSTALDVLQKLISQCLARDEGWKEYYVAEMDKVGSYKAPSGELDLFAMESEAEQHFNSGRIPSAIKTVQELIDRPTLDLACVLKRLNVRSMIWVSR